MASENPKSAKSSENTGETKADRRTRIAEMRRAEQTRERRNRMLTIAIAAVVVAAVIVGGFLLWPSGEEDAEQAGRDAAATDPESPSAEEADEQAEPDAAATGPEALVRGEQTWDDLGRDHVGGDVDYPMSPAAGGDHNDAWANCDAVVYDEEVPEENAVHSLEHGAVWITYNDQAGDADVRALTELVNRTSYTFLSPYPDQESPVTLTAWGHQLGLEQASDQRVDRFVERYVQGAQTPEFGAPCTGGMTP